MNVACLLTRLSMVGIVSSSMCFGSSIGLTTIEQPINLGVRSDPTRIPLGPVGVISNYGYGMHTMISEARACPDGAMHWEGGSELDQNLASVFGISVEPEDPTQVPGLPVVIRLKAWKPPEYSPYTKEQALAATVWCLIRSAGGTPKMPLQIQVKAEADADKHLEVKYSKAYVTVSGEDGAPVAPVKVTGSVLEKDARGITWVTFPKVKQEDSFEPIVPGFILMELDGEESSGWRLLPVWGNGQNKRDPLDHNWRAAPMLYSSYDSRGVRDSNSFLEQGGSYYFRVFRSEDGDSAVFGLPRVPQEMLAANILALVFADQPTEKRSLTVVISMDETQLSNYSAFRGLEDWKETKSPPNQVTFECEFAWDPAERKLIKGSVPLVAFNDHGWITQLFEETPEDGTTKKLARSVQLQIKRGIHDGTLSAERNIGDRVLPKSGLALKIGRAGYYAALGTYSNGKQLPKSPQEEPVSLGDYILDQYFNAGWKIGLGKGEAIAIETRKAMNGALTE